MDSFSVKNSGIETGEIKKVRKVTDVLFSVLLILSLAVTAVLTIKNLNHDNFVRLTGPVSGKFNFCGLGTTKDYPYLYYSDLGTSSLTAILRSGFCVKTCPTEGFTYECNELYCKDPYVLRTLYATKLSLDDICMPESRDNLPTGFTTGYDVIMKNSLSNISEGVHDLQLSKRAIWGAMAVAVVLNLLYIYLMATQTTGLAMISLILIEVSFAAGVASFVWLGFSQKEGTFYAFAFLMGLLALIFNCVLFANWNSFKVAIAVIDATADFFVATKRLVFVSLVSFVFTCLTFAYFGGSLIL